MYNYLNMKYLSRLSYWGIDTGTFKFTNLEIKDTADGFKLEGYENWRGLTTTITVFNSKEKNVTEYKDIPLFEFPTHWSSLEDMQMTEIIVDYITLKYTRLTGRDLSLNYMNILNSVKTHLK